MRTSPTTLDGAQLRPGLLCHCRGQLLDPLLRVRVVGPVSGQLWAVQPEDGLSVFVVKLGELSVAPVAEAVAQLVGDAA